MPTGKSAVAEYMKIRRHILNLTAKAGNESVQLPTALELSKQFGVCRQTVGKALKQLAEDHYVIGKPTGTGDLHESAETVSSERVAEGADHRNHRRRRNGHRAG